MSIPDWYWNFWCPSDMRKYDPEGCGIGLGIGAVLLGVAAIAVITAIVVIVACLWPTKD